MSPQSPLDDEEEPLESSAAPRGLARLSDRRVLEIGYVCTMVAILGSGVGGCGWLISLCLALFAFPGLVFCLHGFNRTGRWVASAAAFLNLLVILLWLMVLSSAWIVWNFQSLQPEAWDQL